MEGLAKLTAALGKNLKIQHVNMKWNQVGAEGAALVAEMMATNTTITSLLLAHNKVGKEGATALAAVLSSQVVRVEAYPQLLAVLGVTAVSRVMEGEEGEKEGVG
jgi:Ran GTPase-activating protein (RanGAP) involved in mRNA processing and transport